MKVGYHSHPSMHRPPTTITPTHSLNECVYCTAARLKDKYVVLGRNTCITIDETIVLWYSIFKYWINRVNTFVLFSIGCQDQANSCQRGACQALGSGTRKTVGWSKAHVSMYNYICIYIYTYTHTLQEYILLTFFFDYPTFVRQG